MNQKRINYPLQDRWSYLWLVIGTLLTLFSTGQWTVPLAAWLGTIFVLRFFTLPTGLARHSSGLADQFRVCQYCLVEYPWLWCPNCQCFSLQWQSVLCL